MPTIREVVECAIPQLAATGVDSPQLNAELLLAHVLQQSRTWLWTYPDHELDPAEEIQFASLLARRVQREPLAYLLGEWEFYGRPFHVTPSVLIPRPETELLVEAVLQWAQGHQARRIADIGAGSGAIAVTLAAEMPSLHLIAIDLSPSALAVTARNAERHGVAERITLLQGDLLQPIVQEGRYPLDAVVANLPYIAAEEFPDLMPEVRDYEPEMALRAGERGLALIKRLISQAPKVLIPGGLLALEVGMGQADEVADTLTDASWRNISIVIDYGGIPRHVLAEAPG
ncbi:MAG: peptide chain release factor N(5)-glutamine methyltransferase [Armatimonadota bacterium]